VTVLVLSYAFPEQSHCAGFERGIQFGLMRFLTLAAIFAFTSAAHAGIVGTTVMTYVIQNNTGLPASSLNVNLFDSQEPTVTSEPAGFSSTQSPGEIDFSGGSVANGSSATFTLEENGDDFFTTPAIYQYAWGSGATESPIYLNLSPSLFDLQSLSLDTEDTTAHTLDDLYVTQNGSSVLAPMVGSSGTVSSASGHQITDNINMLAGPVDFGFTDATDGLTVSGSFTASTPEPAATGICALMLLGIGVVARRRQLRKQ
jgi:hypothetical protein